MTVTNRLAIVMILAVSAPAAAAVMEPQPAGPAPVCAIEIEFHVRRTEIDMRTLDRILAYVEASAAIQRAFDERRGADDPPALCLVIDNAAQACREYAQDRADGREQEDRRHGQLDDVGDVVDGLVGNGCEHAL